MVAEKDRESITLLQNGVALGLCRFSSFGLAIVSFLTFALAMLAVPISGANAPGGGIAYPYLETLAQYPRDYLWQYAALFLLILYLLLFISLHLCAPKDRQVFSLPGLVFSTISAGLLICTYYLQLSIVPISLMSGEREGIALLTQYNPHGLFIVSEELGYIFMLLSFGWLIPFFGGRGGGRTAIRTVFFLAILVSALAYALITYQYGLDRKDRFEIVVISVTWLALIINGVLIGRFARRAVA